MERETSISRNIDQMAIGALIGSLPSTQQGLQELVEKENQRHKGLDPRPSISRHHTLATILGDMAKRKVVEGTAWVYSRKGKRLPGTVLKDEDIIIYKSFMSLAVGMRAIEAFYAEETIGSETLWKWFDEYAKDTVISRIVSKDKAPVEIKPPSLKKMIKLDKRDPGHGVLFTDAYDTLPDRLRFFLNDETASIRTLRTQALPLYLTLDKNITLP